MIIMLANCLDYYLRACERATDRQTRRTFCDQAFGACQYHLMMFHDDQQKVELMWDNYKPKFEALVYQPESPSGATNTDWRPNPGNSFI